MLNLCIYNYCINGIQTLLHQWQHCSSVIVIMTKTNTRQTVYAGGEPCPGPAVLARESPARNLPHTDTRPKQNTSLTYPNLLKLISQKNRIFVLKMGIFYPNLLKLISQKNRICTFICRTLVKMRRKFCPFPKKIGFSLSKWEFFSQIC